MSGSKKQQGPMNLTGAVGSSGSYSASNRDSNSSSYDVYQNATLHPSSFIESTSSAQNSSQDYYHHGVIQQRPAYSTEVERQDTTAMDVANVDREPYSWRYTSSNGGRSLEKISDAHQYVTAMSEIWHVPHTIEAEAFMNDLHQAIDDVKNTYCREYFLTDDKKIIIHLVVAIRNLRGQMREIYYCLQQLTDSSMCKNGADGTTMQIKPTAKWLRSKAAERLGVHVNVLSSSHSSHLSDYDAHHGNNTGTSMQPAASSSSNCRPS